MWCQVSLCAGLWSTGVPLESPQHMSLHSSSSVIREGSTPKDPLYKILDELRSLKLWKEKQERKEKLKIVRVKENKCK